jgi:hypothetical protein
MLQLEDGSSLNHRTLNIYGQLISFAPRLLIFYGSATSRVDIHFHLKMMICTGPSSPGSDLSLLLPIIKATTGKIGIETSWSHRHFTRQPDTKASELNSVNEARGALLLYTVERGEP